jgi:hypothetical protein
MRARWKCSRNAHTTSSVRCEESRTLLVSTVVLGALSYWRKQRQNDSLNGSRVVDVNHDGEKERASSRHPLLRRTAGVRLRPVIEAHETGIGITSLDRRNGRGGMRPSCWKATSLRDVSRKRRGQWRANSPAQILPCICSLCLIASPLNYNRSSLLPLSDMVMHHRPAPILPVTKSDAVDVRPVDTNAPGGVALACGAGSWVARRRKTV